MPPPAGGRPGHVVLVTEQVKPGGKRSHVEALTAGLESIGWQVTLVDWARLAWLERAWVAGPMVVLNHLHKGLGHRWAVPALNNRFRARLRALRREPDGIEVLHVQEATSFPAARDVAGGIPIALTVHGPLHREVASPRGLPLDDPTIQWLREREAEAYRECDAVISVDLAHAEYVRSFGRGHDIHAIPNFVDTRRFHPTVASAALPRELEARLAGRRVLFCPRRLVPKNGVSMAIRATHALTGQAREAVLMIAGDGPERPRLEALVNELSMGDRVLFLGASSSADMPGLFARAHVVLVPSVPSLGIEEATSISALEGEACARPVIASNLGGLREIITDGETGLLVPPGDASALAVAIERLLSDPALASRLGAAGASHVQEHFSHVAGARRYAEVYRTLMERRSRGPREVRAPGRFG